MKSLIIGITGGSGSGKTRIATDLISYFSPDASLIALDNYYHPLELQPLDINGKPNFDLPESLDLSRFSEHLQMLSNGLSIKIKEYTFNNPDLIPKVIEIKSNPILIVEGLFIFHQSEIAKLFDYKIFLDSDEEIKIERRMIRDVQSRGYNLHDVEYSNRFHVKPSFDNYINVKREIVDLIVSNNGIYSNSLGQIVDFIKTKINSAFLT